MSAETLFPSCALSATTPHGKRRLPNYSEKRTGRDAKPFTITLTQDEANELLAPVGEGGHQQLHDYLRSQLSEGNLAVQLGDSQLGKIMLADASFVLKPDLDRLVRRVRRQCLGYRRGEVFICRLRVEVAVGVMRTRLHPRQSHPAQQLAHGALMHLNREAVGDPVTQVDAPEVETVLGYRP